MKIKGQSQGHLILGHPGKVQNPGHHHLHLSGNQKKGKYQQTQQKMNQRNHLKKRREKVLQKGKDLIQGRHHINTDQDPHPINTGQTTIISPADGDLKVEIKERRNVRQDHIGTKEADQETINTERVILHTTKKGVAVKTVTENIRKVVVEVVIDTQEKTKVHTEGITEVPTAIEVLIDIEVLIVTEVLHIVGVGALIGKPGEVQQLVINLSLSRIK